MGPDEAYTIFKIGDRDAAAAYTMRAEQRATGMPPVWMPYVFVADVDNATARAKQLGGAVVAGPLDVMDSGRMSVITDPTGAFISLWQAKAHTGTGVVDEHGAAVWLDLSTSDPIAASRFYQDLFGWKFVEGKSMRPAKPGRYYHIVHGDRFIGGIPPAEQRDPNMPASWLTYFDVADADAAIRKVTTNGGRVLMPAMTMEGVRKFAVLADPQGAAFAIVQTLQPHAAAAKSADKPETARTSVAAPKRIAARRPQKKTKNAAKKAPSKKVRKVRVTKRARPAARKPAAATKRRVRRIAKARRHK
jgi:predicted enzyme related to lactoylglutathione lyase